MKGYKQRWMQKIPNSNRRIHNSNRKMADFSNKAQNSKRGLIRLTGNRGSYKH